MKKSPLNTLTINFTNPEIVTIALSECGGASAPVETEDVAIKAFEMSPSRFSWKKYKDQINLELVRVCLSDAKKPKNGSLVFGSGSQGWSLSPAGVSWTIEHSDRSASISEEKPRVESKSQSPREQRWRRERDRLMLTQAYKEWQNQANIDPQVATEVFRIDSYADGNLVERKIARLIELFADDELSEFVYQAASKVRERSL